jgi:hypothetical protein
MTPSEIRHEITQLASTNSDVMTVEYLAIADESIPIVTLTNGDLRKPNVLIIGRLRGAEPVGTEIIIRLIRHLLTG